MTDRKPSMLLTDESGSMLIEFAISSMVLMSVIFGILDCCRAIYADHFVANAARDATRYAMVRGYTWNGTACGTVSTVNCLATAANVSSYVLSTVPTGIATSNITVSSTWPGTSPAGGPCYGTANSSPGCVVSSTVSYSFNFIFPFLPKNALVLQSTSSVVIQQ